MQKAIIEYSTSATKTASKIVGHKEGEVIGNKIVDAVTRSNDDKIEETRTCWRNNYFTRKKIKY